jgi:hypothetical protein
LHELRWPKKGKEEKKRRELEQGADGLGESLECRGLGEILFEHHIEGDGVGSMS